MARQALPHAGGEGLSLPELELTTVADDEVVVFDGTALRTYPGLEPDRDHDVDGLRVHTLPRPAGERLCRFATVNDVHFGELECGIMEGFELGPVYRAEDGEPPYPETMNRAAIADMTAIEPDAVVVKGDLTAFGKRAEYDRFLELYQGAFGERLHHVRGNHDAYYGETFASDAPFVVDLPGVRLAVLDTSIPRMASGHVSSETLAWLEDAATDAVREGRRVVVFGHHHVWSPLSKSREPGYFGIDPDSSEALIDVVTRHEVIAGYFAGHTHRNRVRRFPATGTRPWVEVACVKDFPGAWAEYRVHEGGIVQVFRRISAAEALAWTEKTRGMFGGLYPDYAFGSLEDRCFVF